MSKQVMKRALDALEQMVESVAGVDQVSAVNEARAAIAELRAAIDAPVEPVAWMREIKAPVNIGVPGDLIFETYTEVFKQRRSSKDMPLYTAPPDTEAMRRDAERYRLLRRGQTWSVINNIGDTLRAEQLDASIDKQGCGE